MREKLTQAQDAFKTNPNQDTAAMFLSVLREAEETGLIGDDEFHNGLAHIEAYLWKGGTVIAPDPDPDYDDQGNLRPGADH